MPHSSIPLWTKRAHSGLCSSIGSWPAIIPGEGFGWDRCPSQSGCCCATLSGWPWPGRELSQRSSFPRASQPVHHHVSRSCSLASASYARGQPCPPVAIELALHLAGLGTSHAHQCTCSCCSPIMIGGHKQTSQGGPPECLVLVTKRD